jgi:stalled ribosome rescue protein Dom34
MGVHHYHAVIWIDHHEARIFHFNPNESAELVLHPDNPTRHIHHKANTIGSGHAAVDQKYLHAVAESVADAGAVLIAGPGSAKTELAAHMHSHEPLLARAIIGVETVDHPSDAELVALARKYMKAADRMRPQES